MAASRPRSFWRDNGLSLVLLAFFLAFLGGQMLTGWHVYNAEQAEHGEAAVAFGAYLTTGHFFEALFENWESEFLQMAAYVVLTVRLFQRGSAESNDPDAPDPDESPPGLDAPGPVRKGGWQKALYRHSLSLTLLGFFLLSLAGHALGGHAEHRADALAHGTPPPSLGEYVTGAQFWFESFQNWQSEFLAVLSLVVLSIWLRQDGSPESKPLAAPHHQTGG